MRSIGLSIFLVLIASSVSGPVNATVLYEEHFDTPSADLTEVMSNYGLTTSATGGYSFFGWNAVSSANVAGGALAIEPPNGDQGSLDIGTFSGDLTITAGVSAQGTSGNVNAGIRVGNNNYIFHPGFLLGVGAFRVDRSDGFQNYEMGFTPAMGVFHTMVIDIVTTAVTSVNITITDGVTGAVYQYDDPTDPWFGFRDTDYNPLGEVIGLTSGGAADNYGLFDYIRIETSNVPAPEGLLLFILGLGTILLRRRQSSLI